MNRQKRGGPYKGSSPPNKKGDFPNSKNSGKRDQNRGKGKSRSPSPTKKTNAKTADDVFSQKIRCRTPPLAYQRRNKSSSPDLKSKKDKCKDKEGKSKESKSDVSISKEPNVKKPRKSRSNSPSSRKSTFEKKSRKKESKSLTERKDSRSRTRSRSNEKQSPRSSIYFDTGKSEDVKISTSSATSVENKNINSSELLGKELISKDGPMVPSSFNTTTISKDPSCNNSDSPDKIPHSESSNMIKTTKSADTEKGDKSVKSTESQSNRSEFGNSSHEISGSRSVNTKTNYPARGNKDVDLSKDNRSIRNISPVISDKRTENMRPLEPGSGRQSVDSSKMGSTGSFGPKNKSCDVQGKRIEKTWSRSRNNSHEFQSQGKGLSQRENTKETVRLSDPMAVVDSRRGCNVADIELIRTVRRKSRSLSRSRDETTSKLSNYSQTAKRRSRSISKEKELRTTRPRSPFHFKNSHKAVGNSSGVPQPNWSGCRSQSNSRVTTVNRAASLAGRSPIQRSSSSSVRANSPQKRARSPSTQARSHIRRSRTPPVRATNPFRRSRSPSVRTSSVRRSRSPSVRTSSVRQSRSPLDRAMSSVRRSRSPSVRTTCSVRRSRTPLARATSSVRRSRSPSVRTTCSVRRSRTPLARATSSVRRSRSPSVRTTCSVRRSRTPLARATSSVRRSRSPPLRSKCPARRSRSPSIRAKSPIRRTRSPASRAISPQAFICRRTSRSPHRDRRRSPQEDIQQKMIDFMEGRRSSPGIETKGQKSAQWLIDMMYQSTSQTPQPVYSSGSGFSQTHPSTVNSTHLLNHQPQNLVHTNSSQVHNYNVTGNEWTNKQYLDHQRGPNTNSYSNNNGPSYPPPTYH